MCVHAGAGLGWTIMAQCAEWSYDGAREAEETLESQGGFPKGEQDLARGNMCM